MMNTKELLPPLEDPGKGLAGGGSSKLKVPEEPGVGGGRAGRGDCGEGEVGRRQERILGPRRLWERVWVLF